MKKKIISMLLCAGAITALLTGCGAESGTNSNKKETTSSVNEVAEKNTTEEETTNEAKMTRAEVEATIKAYHDYFMDKYNNAYDGKYTIEYICKDMNNDGIPEIIYCSKDKYNLVYLEKNEDGSYVANELKEFSYKSYENKPVVVYNAETGSFYGMCSNYKEEGMDRTFFHLFRLSDFRLYNVEFGVRKESVGDAQTYSCSLGVYKELIDDYDAEATAMFDYYINGDNYIEENKEELYRYINKLDDKYYVGSESYVCYEKSDETLNLYVTRVKDWDSATIEKIYNKMIKIRDEWLYDTGSISTIYENDFNSRFPDNDNTKITVKDLAEYVSRKYFWDLYDYE